MPGLSFLDDEYKPVKIATNECTEINCFRLTDGLLSVLLRKFLMKGTGRSEIEATVTLPLGLTCKLLFFGRTKMRHTEITR
jgi:hypothetical protein